MGTVIKPTQTPRGGNDWKRGTRYPAVLRNQSLTKFVFNAFSQIVVGNGSEYAVKVGLLS